MHDRGRKGLKMKHFLYRNKDIEEKPAKSKTSMNKGEISHTLEHDFEEAESLEEMMRGLANYAAVMWFLWPTDYSAIVMLSTSAAYGFFKQVISFCPSCMENVYLLIN